MGEAEHHLLARLDTEATAHMVIMEMACHFAAQDQAIWPDHGSQHMRLALFHPGHTAAVVKTHHQVHGERHLAFKPFDHTHHHVVIAQGHAIGEPSAAAGSDKGGLQDQGVVPVLTADLLHVVARRQAPAPVLLIPKQGGKHRW
ncbi:hypothetical protein D3C77_477810 [compost metagenome]